MFECLNNMHPLGSARGTLGSARGATLGFAQTVRRAKPRREIQCIYTHPLGSARGALGFARGATLGFARGATLGFARGAMLGSAWGAMLGSARGATPRLRSGCNPSAPLGVQSKRNFPCPGKCSFYPNIFTHSPTCLHMKSASGTSV
jgi:hypothetical protein